jgi:hypothetical protein
MNIQNEKKKLNVFFSDVIPPGEGDYNLHSKYAISYDEHNIEKMSLEDLRYLVKSQSKKIKVINLLT